MIFWNDGLRPGIHSFAHGSKFWKISHDAESAGAAIDEANGNIELIALALAQTDVDGTGLEWDCLNRRRPRSCIKASSGPPLRISVDEQRQRIEAFVSARGYGAR